MYVGIIMGTMLLSQLRLVTLINESGAGNEIGIPLNANILIHTYNPKVKQRSTISKLYSFHIFVNIQL